MDTQYIIMIAGTCIIGICISLYAVWYKYKQNRDPNFGKTKLDIYVVSLARKLKKNKGSIFILDNEIDTYFIKGIKRHVHSFFLTNNKIFIFKYYSILGPTDPSVIAEEEKWLFKFSEKLNMEIDDFEFIKFYKDKIFLNKKEVNMKKFKDLPIKINEFILNNQTHTIDITKMYKVKLNKS